MGPDPQTQMTDALSAATAQDDSVCEPAREFGRAATTASMQSLLAGYFESKGVAHKVHAFS
eukprot:gene14412-18239_t